MTSSSIDMNEHIRPQWACTGFEKLPINFVGRVETMQNDVIKLFEMGYLDEAYSKVQAFERIE